MVEKIKNGVIGIRKFLFGLVSITWVSVVEITCGWTKVGIGGMVAVVALFYGPPVINALTGLVKAWRGKSDV